MRPLAQLKMVAGHNLVCTRKDMFGANQAVDDPDTKTLGVEIERIDRSPRAIRALRADEDLPALHVFSNIAACNSSVAALSASFRSSKGASSSAVAPFAIAASTAFAMRPGMP